MKAVVYHGSKDLRVEEVPDPKIKEPTDVIIKTTRAAICGSDLHLYGGFNPFMEKGDILGHEFMGEIIEAGSGVKSLKVGDKIVVPFDIGCGMCRFCKLKLWSLCDHTNPKADLAEKTFGYTTAALYGYSHLTGGIPGGQAEMVRVINADVNAFKVPSEIPDEKVLFLGDIFPTGFMAAENALRGQDIKTVAVFGCGPVGLFTIKSLQLLGIKDIIAVDQVPERVQLAKKIGARTIDFSKDKDVVEQLKKITDKQGPDAVVDAVGSESDGGGMGTLIDKGKQNLMIESDRPIALRQAIQACRKGGVISIPGVFLGLADSIPMGTFMNKGLTAYTGQTHVQNYTKRLFEFIEQGKIDTTFLITHRISIDEVPEAYKMFREKKDKCIKVVIEF